MNLEAQWEELAGALPPEMAPAQRRAVKRAFYAGAVAALLAVDAAIEDPDNGAERLHALQEEATAFFRSLPQ